MLKRSNRFPLVEETTARFNPLVAEDAVAATLVVQFGEERLSVASS